MKSPHFSKIHNQFELNGFHYDKKSLTEVSYSFVKEGDPFEQILGTFLYDWLNPKATILLETSGTTGVSKKIEFDKQAMVNSAIATGDYFGLTVRHKALHCLPANYIAGKMMLIRAMVLGFSLDLIRPTVHPLEETEKTYDFVAMTPMQASHSLPHLERVKTLIVGGGQVPEHLQNKLKQIKGLRVFETYGMTETLSHIAVRTMDDPYAQFHVLPNVNIHQDDRGCLVIDAPYLFVKNLKTNDKVEILDKKTFRLLGRIDNMINSGGIKIHAEQIERVLARVLYAPFFVGSIPHDSLGEQLTLVVQAKKQEMEKVRSIVKECQDFGKYEKPKILLGYSSFVTTESGKIKRKETLKTLYHSKLDL